MTRQATDNLYIELDYFTPEEYYTYEAVAACTQSTEFTLGCDAELIAGGEIVEANGSWSSEFAVAAAVQTVKESSVSLASEFTQSVTVNKIVNFASSMSSEFAQSTIAQRTKDIDLFAFTDAAIAVEVSVIRSTNVALSSVFDISTDGRRFRDLSAEEAAVFNCEAVTERSRAFIIETQAAFSFDAVVGVIKGAEATVSAESQTTVNSNRVRYADSSQSSEFALSAIISHIEGADIVADGFASMTLVAEKTAVGASTINTAATVSAIIGSRKQQSAALSSNFIVTTSNYLGTGRPFNLTQFSPSYNTSIKKFGSASLTSDGGTGLRPTKLLVPLMSNNFYYEGWVYPVNANQSRQIFEIANFVRVSLSSGRLRIVTIVENTLGTDFVNFFDVSTESALSTGTWHHWAYVKTGTRYSFYVNGTRIATTTTVPRNYWALRSTNSAIQVNGNVNNLVDEVMGSRVSDLGYDAASTSITVPTSARINDFNTTNFLYHLDGNNLDDLRTVYTFTSNQTAVSTLTAKSNNASTQGIANLSASSSVLAVASKNLEINLVAFAESTVSAIADKLKIVTADLSSEFSESVDATITRTVAAELAVETNISSDALRIQPGVIQTESIATQLTAVAKVGDFLVDLNSDFQQSTEAVKTTDVEIAVNSEFEQTTEAVKTTDSDIDVTAVVELTSAISLTKRSAVPLFTQFNTVIDVNRTAGLSADLDSEFMVMADPAGSTIRIDSQLFAQAELSALGAVTKFGVIDAQSEFAVYADTFDSVSTQGQAALEDQFSISVELNRIRFNESNFASITTQMVVVAKIVADLADLEITANLAADVNKIASASSDLTASCSEIIDGLRIRSFEAGLPLVSDVSATGRLSSEAAADMVSEFNINILAAKNTEIILSAFTNAGLTAGAERIRGTQSSMAAQAQSSATVLRIRPGQIQTEAIATEMVTVGVVLTGVATLTAQFALTAAARVIHTDKYVYKIPQENRSWRVSAENRTRIVQEETRVYTIRRY
jgi:hypothetical protein